MTTVPRARAEELREAAGTDADVVNPDEVKELLRYPARDVQRHAAVALLGIVTEFPEVGTSVVDRLVHLLSTLDENAPGGESTADRDAFAETLLLCLARVATYDAEHIMPVRDAVVDRLEVDEAYSAAASVCLLQLLEADPGVFVPHAERIAALLDADAVPTRRHGAHALSELAAHYPSAAEPAVDGLERCLDDADTETVQKALTTLGLLARHDPGAVAPSLPAVVDLMTHEEPHVRTNAAGVVADVADGHPDAVRPLLADLGSRLDDAAPVRRNLTTAFERVAAAAVSLPGPAEGAVLELLDDHDPTVRARSCRTLGHTRSPAALELLRTTATRDAEPSVREAAQWAVDRITA